MSSILIAEFLKELIANNNREWFNAHKDEYLAAHQQFDEIVEKLIRKISRFDESVSFLVPKDCTYRIYRDIRFSKDKTPYKEHFGAYINENGKKAYYGGYYIQIDAQECVLGGGVWYLPTKELLSLKQAIVDQVDTYRSIVEDPTFKKHFPSIGKNQAKRISNGLPKDFPYPEYLLCKDYVCSCHLPHSILKKPDAANYMADIFETMKPFNEFLKENILINLEEMESMKDIVKIF